MNENSIDSRLAELYVIRERIRYARAVPQDHKDLLYDGVPRGVQFEVSAGTKYWETPEENPALTEIIRRYVRCEYYKKERQQEYAASRIMQDLKRNRGDIYWSCTGWRLSVHPTMPESRDSFEDAQGFTATINYNPSLEQPTPNSPFDFEHESQLEYRSAVTEIEIFLIEQGIEYTLIDL